MLASTALGDSPIDDQPNLLDYHDERLATEAFYGCTATPSHLVLRAIDAVGEPYEARVFLGFKSDCERQARELRRYRYRFSVPGTAAICAGTPKRLHRFVIQPALFSWGHVLKAGRVVRVTPQLYASFEDLREYARRLNGADSDGVQ